MRTFLFSILFVFSSLSHASNDPMADTFHHRMELREPYIYQGTTYSEASPLPASIEDVRQWELESLLEFARIYDLFSVGFSYELHPVSYVGKKEGETISYSFSIDILKHGELFTRRLYFLARRVDGVFYTYHIGNYDY